MSLSKSSFLFSIGTFISRISGLLRDQVLAYSFGASVIMDAFTIAYRIPNLFREMLAEGALANAFTKVYSDVSLENSKKASEFLNEALVRFVFFGIAFTVTGILLSDYLVSLMTLKASGEVLDSSFVSLASLMTKWLFPFLSVMMIGAITMGALHQKGNFFVTSVSSISLNVGFILGSLAFGAVVSYLGYPVFFNEQEAKGVGLAIGILGGGILHVFWQFWYLRKEVQVIKKIKCLFMPVSKEFKSLLIIMLPASLAASSGPINQFVNTNFATSLGPGVVSWLYYAMNLFRLPVGIFGVAVGVAALPALTKAVAISKDPSHKSVISSLQKANSLILWLTLPCSLFLFFMSESVIVLLYQHGSFGLEDVSQTSSALKAYTFGIIGYGLLKVFTSFYFAVERTKFALKAAFICILVNFSVNYFLVDKFGHVGLATTSVVTLTINALILLIGMKKNNISIMRLWKSSCLIYLILASIIVVGFSYLLEILDISKYLELSSNKSLALLNIIIHGGMVLGVFVVMASVRFKINPITMIQKRLRDR